MSTTAKIIDVLPAAPSDADILLCSQWGITYPQLLDERATAMVFRFPMPENYANKKSGPSSWRSIFNRKLAYWRVCDMLMMAGQLPEPPAERWPVARIQSKMVLGGAMDTSNAMARHKWIEDWLVTRAYILTDRKTGLLWADFPAQRVTRKEQAHIIITLTRPAR
jgi:hypothetical protein